MIKEVLRNCLYACGMRPLYAGVAAFYHDWFCKFPCRLRQRLAYRRTVRRIRAYQKDRRIVVLFVVSYASKWKTQGLYALLRNSSSFDAKIVLTVEDFTYAINPQETLRGMCHDRKFYESLGDMCEYGVNPESGLVRPLIDFHPDIVFFQSPGAGTMAGHRPKDIMGTALCCYVPYSLETFCLPGIYRESWFHELMFFQDAPSVADAAYISKGIPWHARAGKIIGFGHTIFDEYANVSSEEIAGEKPLVIYAPHFSFPISRYTRPSIISSFMENGRQILAYAQRHPEMNWLFKPHPSLRRELTDNGGWSAAEVQEYYHAWETLGQGYYDGNYIRLFKRSRAMITDCSSFLVEYPLTGKPLIRLIPKITNVQPRPSYGGLFSSFYQVRNAEDMRKVFEQVLERGEDPLLASRNNQVEKLGLRTGNSSQRIYHYLCTICGRSE